MVAPFLAAPSARSIRLATWLYALALASTQALAEEEREFFERKVRPILVERCEKCHSRALGKTSGGLALDTRDGWEQGGDSGVPIVPGKSNESLLVRAIRYDADGPQMPPKDGGGPLPESEIVLLTEWIERGAIDPRETTARVGGMTTEESRSWWSFQPPIKVTPPIVEGDSWSYNEIDRFVISELDRQSLRPSAKADKRTLIRRATLDVTGLPPTPDEVEAFLQDTSIGAFERVIDRLLDSAAYGQRWARHWLDVARYADYYDANPMTRTASCEITEAWRYRDWVVDALNSDLPFDQFIEHQIAGDLLPSPTGEEIYPGGLIATTFLTNGVWDRGDADKEKIVSDMADDNIDVIGKAFLGLTLGCARCHDHKFDPITTEDYYALAGMFYSSHILKELGAKGAEYTMNRVPLAPSAVVREREEQLKRIAEVRSEIAALDKQDPKPPADDPLRMEVNARQKQLVDALIPEPPLAIAMQEGGTPGGIFPGIQDVPIHIRGSYARLGSIVPRGLPKRFVGESQPRVLSGSGRRELAAWVASEENPLTARVIVNRIWQWHFGQGIVRTPSNFGRLGERPTHPALLDWLANAFVEDGWSLKRLHKRIMSSSTYQQSSRVDPLTRERDPENRWVSRFERRRLEAESIRDSMLFVSGQLDGSVGGPAGDDFTIARRSLYVQTARWDRGSYAILFDAANPDSSAEKRQTSTVAPQSLLLLNHPFVHDLSRRLSERLQREVPVDDGARIDRAYELLFGRPPSYKEREVARSLIDSNGESGWVDWAHVLLCSNEFVTLD